MSSIGYIAAILLVCVNIEIFGLCGRWMEREDAKIMAGRPERGAVRDLLPVYAVLSVIFGCTAVTTAVLSHFGAFIPAVAGGCLLLATFCCVAAMREIHTPGFSLVRACRKL